MKRWLCTVSDWIDKDDGSIIDVICEELDVKRENLEFVRIQEPPDLKATMVWVEE
jgi:hypothetical protein